MRTQLSPGQLSDLRLEGTAPHKRGADGWTMASASAPACASIASRRARCFGADASVLSTSSSSRASEWSIARGRARSRVARSARCELLDWRSRGAKDGRRARRAAASDPSDPSDPSGGARASGAAREGSLWLPGSRASATIATVNRRGLLLAGGVASVAAAADLAAPPPSRAFIDLPSRLHNRYFLVRHGESTLDTRGMFLTNPSFKYDTTYGLTRAGAQQMHLAAQIIQDEYDGAPSWLYTSNFQRSFQSALILREDLGMLFSQLRTEFSGLLDPRKMGDLDFKSTAAWPSVWEGDARDPLNTPPPVPASLQPSASVESPRDLYRRALECFTRLESTYFGEDVVLVSHADTLSLFTAALMGTNLCDHHKDWAMELGEVRCVDLTSVPQSANFSPTDLRGEYAVGDKAVNYYTAGGKSEEPE